MEFHGSADPMKKGRMRSYPHIKSRKIGLGAPLESVKLEGSEGQSGTARQGGRKAGRRATKFKSGYKDSWYPVIWLH